MNVEHFKEKLLKEKSRLETELSHIGIREHDGKEVNSENWEANTATLDVDTADDTELADKFEELGNNEAIISSLEIQLKDVVAALEKIEQGTYGACETNGHPIEEDRLEANPSARTCKEHMK